ncbi:phage tail protein [Dialister invisus]|uniref:phage tail protein n=1 Tax=Dialister invisus TaxID=218538 RepID=UPI002352F4D2|nr:phage tail protein [Dialister invisus]
MSFFRGRTTTTRANKISEFTVNTAEYGAVVPEIIGTVRTAGNVIYYDDFTAHEHRETHKAGKGGKSKQVSITYTYTVAVILGLCEGPISGIGKVWIGKNVHNYPADDIQLTLFDGKENQQPWAYTQGKHPDKALPYSGLAYMAGVINLGDSGSMPSYNFEVKGRLLETGDGIDVNPADYIRYVLDKIGKKDMQIIGLDNYRKYCKEADLLISSPPDEDAKAAREVVNEIAKLTNAYVFWSNDKLKIVPLADRPVGNWAPDKTGIIDLTADDFLPQSGGALVTYKRKDSSAIYNQFPVEFINRANGYEKESVSYEFTEDIKNYGVRAASVTNAHYIYTKERAVKIAEQLARNNKYERTQYTFKLDWSLCRLEVGDLVRLTDENSGIYEQVAVINGITEGTDGCLMVTAISRAPGDYPAAKYNIHANDRPYIDYNKTAPDTVPVIFQPPADLTSDGLELWIAAKGKADGWGGCTVYVSDDNTNYRTVGQIAGSARCGKLIQPLSPMPNHPSGNQVFVTCNDQLLGGTPQGAERKNTLCWIDGECMSYINANLQAGGAWLLSGLYRGQCNTAVRTHAKDTDFVRLDNSVFKVPFAKDDIGKKIYIKFCSYNIFGAGNQDLSEVKAYEYTLTPYYIPPVTNITAHNRYRQLADGVSRYDIVVNWTPPTLQSYLQGDVWYKTSNAPAKDLVIKEGTKGSELGFDGEWTFGGSGKDQVVIPQAIVGDTYLIAVCTKDEWGETTSPDTSPQLKILVALKTEIPNTPDGFGIDFGAACTASWKEVTNTDVAFYEIRTDQSPGAETSGLLVRTNNLSAILPLTERSGTLYLYAKSAIGKYSAPAILQYNKPIPKKPNPPVLTSTIGGFGLTAEAIPNDCAGMNIYINGTDGQKTIKNENNSYSHTCGAGIYDVSIAYYDLFGEGEKSGESRVVVKISISKDMLEDEAISLEKVDKLIKQKLNDGAVAKQDVTTIVSNLGNLMLAKANYSAIAQMTDAINLRVQKGDVINQINLSPTTTTIASRYLHVGAKTVIDNNVIVSRMLAAKAVTADKLAVTSLSAITANIGILRTKTSGARTEIKDNLIEIYDNNNFRVIALGVLS